MNKARGSALLNAIVVAGIIAGIAGVIMTQTQITDRASRAPRVRSAMALLQSRVQLLALQAGSYNCPGTNVNSLAGCKVNTNVFTSLSSAMTGAVCASGTGCGIKVEVTKPLDVSNLSYEVTISYEGTEIPIKPMKIPLKVLPEALAIQTQQDTCPLATPIFTGYNTVTGTANCNALPVTCKGGGALTNQGTYISGVDPMTMQPICSSFGVSVAGAACSANQYLQSFTLGASGTTGACIPSRQDPFAVFTYTPTSATPQSTILITSVLPALTTTTTTTTSTTSSTTTTLAAPTTTMPPTAWNCSDGFATAAPCNASMVVQDDGNLSPNNPGVASLYNYVLGGDPASKCQCSSGTLTVISCSGNNRFIVCSGAVNPPLACPWPGGASVPKSCAPSYGSPAPGGWSCLGPPSTFWPCP